MTAILEATCIAINFGEARKCGERVTELAPKEVGIGVVAPKAKHRDQHINATYMRQDSHIKGLTVT
jgi:regulator of extracellular matrix RemA (YlzA/DUF370 family)